MQSNTDKERFYRIHSTKHGKEGHFYRRGVLLSELETPTCPFPCKMILPDPLTFESVRRMQKRPFISVPYSAIVPCLPMLEEYERVRQMGGGLRPFVDFEDSIMLLTFRNVFESKPVGVEGGKFSLYTDSTRYFMDEKAARSAIDLIRPQISIVPCEELRMVDSGSWSNRKRARANKLYGSYTEAMADSQTHLISTAHIRIDGSVSNDNDGVELSGFGYGESIKERGDALQGLLQGIDGEKLRILQLQTGTPLEILHAILLGIDVIVSPYPQLLSKMGIALTFDLPEDCPGDHGIAEAIEMLETHCKFGASISNDGTCHYVDSISHYIDLNDAKYARAVSEKIHPASICRESRGYINHLLICNEMNGEITVLIHNQGMYELLFERARRAMDDGTLPSFICEFIKLNGGRSSGQSQVV
ncbi:conserved hypothetical protein [Theileria equi strain WA]|uniref:tRNA-guanine(15) transglycosylase-like domain-containing protein n=1 Tax=Theileria equi strain WA TaxID=1537102 RepID=L1LDI1_THEEQ|nr:conserved hypothetical protein [Theileria equi strain WA]EKX73406.1 conserved hypothetical protein [Theileria equi strain WA]|eukprot:XP_004832858.1 conserved hypothetical protein [Theileria equi strain WA]